VQLILVGISLGSIYALIALGFVTIYRGTGVINLAQGSLLLLGAYVVALVAPDRGFFVGVAAGLVAAGAGAVVLERITAAARTDDHLALTILTIGVDVLLATELSRRIGASVLTMRDPWGDGTVGVLGSTVPEARLYATAVAGLVILGLFLLYRQTSFGLRMRASTEDSVTASLMGISLRRTRMASWIIGGSMACLAGVFLACFPNPGLDHTSGLIALNAIPAIIIGGLDSPVGAIVGGIVVGITQSVIDGNAEAFAFLGQGSAAVAPYVLMLVVLFVRPTGLFGSQELTRV